MSTPSFLTRGPLRRILQQIVSAHTGRRWRVRQARDMADFASHPAAILSDGAYAVFAKFSAAADGGEQLQAELGGLRMLRERAGVLVPTPIGVYPVSGGHTPQGTAGHAPQSTAGHILLMEAVQAVERGLQQWRQIGQALSRIHQVKRTAFGLESNGYFGPLPQDNEPLADWPAFYAERRLIPGLKLALDSGNMPAEAARRVERLIERLPGLCGPAVTPTLIHGDAQQNNFISSAAGAVAIDPAVYFGHPEVDLAFVDYFAPAPMEDVLDGYREEGEIDPGFPERRDLWRVWGWLACVAVEGGGYVDKLNAAVQKYL